MKLELYDTTLRDGAQKKGISFSLADKLKIVQKLDEMGFHYIEGGWPGSNPKDAEFFRKVQSLKLNQAIITAFSMTGRKGIKPAEDINLQQLLAADTKVVTLVGKSWDFQVAEVLRTNLKENLNLIKESCGYFLSRGKRVFYDAEHFFDGFKTNPGYALQTLRMAVGAGAERIILCDTNGGALPWEITQIMERVKKEIRIPLGIHAHNDGGLATANTLMALKSGAIQIQGTINGYGERCGNADFCSIIPTLQLKMGFTCLFPEQLARLTELSHYVAEICNLSPEPSQPYVGSDAFAHKGGIHVDAIAKNKASYQHIDPQLVGNFSQIVVSELSGKANVLVKAHQFGIDLSRSSQEALAILTQIKELEKEGFQFEGADGSLELLIRRRLPDYKAPFQFLDFTVSVKKSPGENSTSKAMIKLRVGNKIIQGTAEGNGPVDALNNAARKALLPFYPQLEKVHLTDYKVRILDGKEGTAARVRVLIDSADENGQRWSTVGSSTNIIEASWQALMDSWEYTILKSYLNKKDK